MAVGNGDGNTNPHLLLDNTVTSNDEDELTCYAMVMDMATATSAITLSLDARSCHIMATEMAGPTPSIAVG